MNTQPKPGRPAIQPLEDPAENAKRSPEQDNRRRVQQARHFYGWARGSRAKRRHRPRKERK